MKEIIKARKEQLQKRGKKGFTLMEMLIVVAIIAILIAIAIPVFLNQLESARDATSVANIRSAYAEASAAHLTHDSDGTTVTFGEATGGGTDYDKVIVHNVKLETSDNSLGNAASELPFEPTGTISYGDKTATFTFNADGTVGCVLS